jgi:hypothetical protein
VSNQRSPFRAGLESSPPEGPLLVVSPELGDAALSCAALLDRVDPLTVLDVFTATPEPDRVTEWDRASGFESARAAMAAREHEEAAAFVGTNHEVLAVDLLARRYSDGERDDSDVRRFRRALESWVGRAGPCTVALPAGAGLTAGAAPGLSSWVRGALGGRHAQPTDPDHLWVRDVATRILGPFAEITLVLYEELPHLESLPADRAVDLYAGWSRRHATLRTLPVDRARKAKRLAKYASVTPGLRGGGRRLAHNLPHTERYWVLHRLEEPATSPTS